jgi:predicted anti-sigma-YlaC factor YlaD
MMESNKSECKRLLSQLSELIDGDLNSEICVELEQHLKDCQNCRIVYNTTKRTIELYHEADEKIEFPTKARGKLFKKLHLDQFNKS